MPDRDEIMVTSTTTTTTNETTKSSSSFRRRRRRRAAATGTTSSVDDSDEEKYQRASLVLEHYRSFRYSRSLDIILEHTEEQLDGCCEDTDFRHFIASSPRYNKKFMKKTQTFSCLTSLVPDNGDEEFQQQRHLGPSLGSIDADPSFLLLEDGAMMNYSPPSSLPANRYRST
jgi:hypothetical protein